MDASHSARHRGRKSGLEMSQKDKCVNAPKPKSKSKEVKQKGILEKGPRVQDDVISVAANLIEENKNFGNIVQDKYQKLKSVDNDQQTSTTHTQQNPKTNLNQQNKEKTDLYAQRGSCSLDISPTTAYPLDVSLHQLTKQNLLVEGPTQDGMTSPTEDLINENPSIGNTSLNKHPRSKSSTTEEVFLEMSPTVQNQQMPNSDGIKIPTRTQQEERYVQKGNCSVDMLSTSSCSPDVSINQSTKQNLLVERPNQDGITSSAEDLINENPPIGKNSQDEYTRSKSNDSNHSSTTIVTKS